MFAFKPACLTSCLLVALPLVAACVPVDLGTMLPEAPAPEMAWDHRPEANEWTASALTAVAENDRVLAAAVPDDIATWCPGYETASMGERRAFWAGLLSAVAKYESTWNPQASGGGGRWIGLMQISPASARNYGCEATTKSELKDGSANLECAVELLAYQVERDGLVSGDKGKHGIGRDWAPLRSREKRAAMAEWTASQSYCSPAPAKPQFTVMAMNAPH